ncbi:MAG: dihydropteroate synthase [Gammaproteobacteria bacterium]|nr:MAG: dihydropteroate synthase [Gammaproteobacteria bacterium]
MGILNVTPDSFSDGGQYTHIDQAVKRAFEMVDEGAAVIDIGGESTRPGAGAVSAQQEINRVIPVIERLASELDTPVSIDTSKPEVMQAAVDAGACMINDVYALRQPGALEMAVQLQVPVCLMHMQGEPRTMQDNPQYDDVVADVRDFLSARVDAVIQAGLPSNQIIIDPGFGFGKTLEQNYQLLAGMSALSTIGCPILAGISRKSMIGNLLNVATEERVAGSLAAAVIAVMNGASIVRVHDVRETVHALRVLTACREAEDRLKAEYGR